MTAFRLALLTLWRKRSSALIALLSIALSVASSGILLRLYFLSESRFSTLANGGDALVGAKAGGIEMLLGALNEEGPDPGFLPMKLFESLRAGQDVHFSDGQNTTPNFLRQIVPLVFFAKSQSSIVVGTDESFITRLRPAAGSVFSDGQWFMNDLSLVVGSEVAKTRNLHVGDSVEIEAWAGDELARGPKHEFKISGILKPTASVWDRNLFASLATAQRALSEVDLSQKSIWGPQVLHYFLVDLMPGGGPQLENLINRRTVGQIVFVEKEKARLRELSGVGEQLGLALTILILFLGSLCVASMLLSRFEGMATQIAVLRALGHPKSFLFLWLISEGLLIGGASVLLGASLDGLAFPFLRESFGQALPAPDLVSSSIFMSAPIWLTALITTAIAVFFPLWRISRQSVHQALRS